MLYSALRLWPESYPDTEAVWAPDLRDLRLVLLRELADADEAIGAESDSNVKDSAFAAAGPSYSSVCRTG